MSSSGFISMEANLPSSDEMPFPMPTVASTSERRFKKSQVILPVLVLGFFLAVLGFAAHPTLAKPYTTHFRSLLEKTLRGEVMPAPFWINRQSVPDSQKVQYSFTNFYFLKDKVATLTQGDETFTATFWEGVKKTDSSGKVTKLGFFNPLSPKGLPSSTVLFEYGDICPEKNDYNEGQVELVCGSGLEITSVSMIADCRYKVIVATPEMCSSKATHAYVKGTSVSAADGGWWQFKINFFVHTDKASPVYQFHAEGVDSERFLLGTIDHRLNSEGAMTFSNGDMCDPISAPREGVIKFECGCDYEIASLHETSVCVYEFVVKHPKSCVTPPDHCEATSSLLRSEEKMTVLRTNANKPSNEEVYSTHMDASAFPRDLLNAKYSK